MCKIQQRTDHHPLWRTQWRMHRLTVTGWRWSAPKKTKAIVFVERTEKRTDSENNECSLPPFSRTRILPTEHSFFRRFWKSPAMRLKVYMSLYASLPARWAGKTSGILCCIGVRLQKRQRRLCTSNRVALQQVAYGTSRKGAINRVRVDTLCAFPWLALSVCVRVCLCVSVLLRPVLSIPQVRASVFSPCVEPWRKMRPSFVRRVRVCLHGPTTSLEIYWRRDPRHASKLHLLPLSSCFYFQWLPLNTVWWFILIVSSAFHWTMICFARHHDRVWCCLRCVYSKRWAPSLRGKQDRKTNHFQFWDAATFFLDRSKRNRSHLPDFSTQWNPREDNFITMKTIGSAVYTLFVTPKM